MQNVTENIDVGKLLDNWDETWIMLVCKKSGKHRTDRIRRNQKTEKSSSGFTEEKGRVHHTVRTTCKRISEITDQSWKEEEPAGEHSGTAE